MKKIKNDVFAINSQNAIEFFNAKDVLYVVSNNDNTAIFFAREKVLIANLPLKCSCRLLHGYVDCIGDRLAVDLAKISNFDKESRMMLFISGDSLELKPEQAKRLCKILKSIKNDL
jgi:hypothetical protein